MLMYLNYSFFYRHKFGQMGSGETQLYSPRGFCLGLNDEIIVADTYNNRVQIFGKDGIRKMQFGIPGMQI